MDTLFALPYGPLLIFAIRVVDVSMGTIRLIVMVRGRRAVAAMIGFVEVLLWIVAVGYALQHLDSIYHVIGYAGGFAAGNFLGVTLEERLALGLVVVRAIIPDEGDGATAAILREHGFAVTQLEGHGREGPVDVLNTVVKRRQAPDVIDLIETTVPRSFVTVEEIRTTRRGFIRPRERFRPLAQLVRR